MDKNSITLVEFIKLYIDYRRYNDLETKTTNWTEENFVEMIKRAQDIYGNIPHDSGYRKMKIV